MRYSTERVLSLVAVIASTLGGAYIGHVNTLDNLQAQHDRPCTTTVTRSCTTLNTYNGTPLTVWHDAQGHTWYNATQDKRI